MEVDRREKSVEQSTNAILNPSARSENTFFVNCPVVVQLMWLYLFVNFSVPFGKPCAMQGWVHVPLNLEVLPFNRVNSSRRLR